MILPAVFVHGLSVVDVTLEEFASAAMVNPLLVFRSPVYTVQTRDLTEFYALVIKTKNHAWFLRLVAKPPLKVFSLTANALSLVNAMVKFHVLSCVYHFVPVVSTNHAIVVAAETWKVSYLLPKYNMLMLQQQL